MCIWKMKVYIFCIMHLYVFMYIIVYEELAWYSKFYSSEPLHNKTNKMSVRPAKNLIRVFAVRSVDS